MNNKKFEEFLMENLENHDEAVAYLNAALEESFKNEEESRGVFLIALRNVVKAKGGLGYISEKAKISRESLYKTLSKEGNPEWKTLLSLFKVMNIKITIKG